MPENAPIQMAVSNMLLGTSTAVPSSMFAASGRFVHPREQENKLALAATRGESDQVTLIPTLLRGAWNGFRVEYLLRRPGHDGQLSQRVVRTWNRITFDASWEISENGHYVRRGFPLDYHVIATTWLNGVIDLGWKSI